MCSGSWRVAALCSKFSTLSAPASSRRYAMSAKLSRTEPGIPGFFQCFFFLLVFRPPLPEWLFAGFPLQNAASAFDGRASDRLEQDSLRCHLHNRFGAVFDFKFPADPPGNDNLAFDGE